MKAKITIAWLFHEDVYLQVEDCYSHVQSIPECLVVFRKPIETTSGLHNQMKFLIKNNFWIAIPVRLLIIHHEEWAQSQSEQRLLRQWVECPATAFKIRNWPFPLSHSRASRRIQFYEYLNPYPMNPQYGLKYFKNVT